MFANIVSIDKLQELSKNSLSDHLGVEFTEVGADYIIAKMPVDHRTRQPFGILHGGASVALAETLGSVASLLCLKDTDTQQAVGLDINANHIRPIKEGFVYGKVKALHIGRSTHIWEIKITDIDEKLVCISRLTVTIIETRN
jgi:1,4-dihydroxy-2-naphthoyl-CoA hydrolase|tara:strand:+ start:231 stop:656 length:426 start_codon:yes stop_codon:yes gene_type:complete